MIDNIMGAPTMAGADKPTDTESPQPSTFATDPASMPIPGAGGKTETQIVEEARKQTESNPSPIMQPENLANVQRGADGKFIASPKGTKVNDNYAKDAGGDDDASPTAGGETETDAEGESGADPASAGQDDSWSAGFAAAFRVPIEAVSKASKAIGDDFGRVMSEIQSGRINPAQLAAPANANAPAPLPNQAGSQAQQAQAAAGGFRKFSQAEIDAFNEDNYDETSAKSLRTMAEQQNALIDAIARIGNPDEIAQRAAKAAESRVVEQSHQQVLTKVIEPFFGKITKEHPELSALYGGKNRSLVQAKAMGAFLDAAGAYQQVKAAQGVQISDDQALRAAFANIHADVLEKAAKSGERRASATVDRHRSRDISMGRAQSSGNMSAGELTREQAARAFLASTKSTPGHG